MMERQIDSAAFVFDTYPEYYGSHGSYGTIYFGPLFIRVDYYGMHSFPIYEGQDYWVMEYGSFVFVHPEYPYHYFYPYPIPDCSIVPSSERTELYVVCGEELVRGNIVEINYIDKQILFNLDYNPEWGGYFPPNCYPYEGMLDIHVGFLIDNPIWALRILGNFNHNIRTLGAELRIRYNIYTGPKTIVIEGEAPIGDEWDTYEYDTYHFFARPRLSTVLTYDLNYGNGYQTIDVYPIIEEMINHPDWQDGRTTHLFLTAS